jgi:hypothetical protein
MSTVIEMNQCGMDDQTKIIQTLQQRHPEYIFNEVMKGSYLDKTGHDVKITNIKTGKYNWGDIKTGQGINAQYELSYTYLKDCGLHAPLYDKDFSIFLLMKYKNDNVIYLPGLKSLYELLMNKIENNEWYQGSHIIKRTKQTGEVVRTRVKDNSRYVLFNKSEIRRISEQW